MQIKITGLKETTVLSNDAFNLICENSEIQNDEDTKQLVEDLLNSGELLVLNHVLFKKKEDNFKFLKYFNCSITNDIIIGSITVKQHRLRDVLSYGFEVTLDQIPNIDQFMKNIAANMLDSKTEAMVINIGNRLLRLNIKDGPIFVSYEDVSMHTKYTELVEDIGD